MNLAQILKGTAAAAAFAVAAMPALAADYKLVVMQSLTGAAAFIGASVADGAVMAFEEMNASNFFGEGNSVVFEVADDATDRTQTLSLITRYAADPAVIGVMGPTSGAVALAAAALANELSIPIVSTSNSHEVIERGRWSNILTQPGDVTIPYIAQYAVEVLGVKSCAIISIRDVEAYVALQRMFEAYVQERGVKLASVDGIAVTDSDFSSLATRIANADQDCVFIGAPAAQGANIIIQLKQAGLDPSVKIIGHNAFSSPAFVSTGGAAVEGVYLMGSWVPGGFDDRSRDFAARFQAWKNVPADDWNAVGYSGAYVLATALKNAMPNVTRESFTEALVKVTDVPVVIGDGIYSYDDKRVPRFGMKVLTVKNGAFVEAPR
jgi:branched-chain amino acid transport system substrate-binding protein